MINNPSLMPVNDVSVYAGTAQIADASYKNLLWETYTDILINVNTPTIVS